VIANGLLKKMISYASICEKDTVLEVGSGLGFLTKLLSKVSGKVLAVELDPRLVMVLKSHVRDHSNITLIEGDILRVIIPRFNKVVSAPPYSISSRLLFWLLEKGFDTAVLLLQKEFAERLSAPVSSKSYSPLTIITSYLFKIDFLDHISRKMFYPSPSIDSVVFRLIPKKPPFSVENKKIFFWLIKALFTQRNRKGRKALFSILQKKGIKRKDAIEFADSHLFLNKRIRELTLRDFGILANSLDQDLQSTISSQLILKHE
jgi:16S rRNA (adenine1518-N6/adenine1519-N6)-dimethyltransferase